MFKWGPQRFSESLVCAAPAVIDFHSVQRHIKTSHLFIHRRGELLLLTHELGWGGNV